MDDHRPAARPSRRAVLRAVGTAAWSVPVVVMAGPASAGVVTSTPSATILVLKPIAQANRFSQARRVDHLGTLENNGPGSFTGVLTVVASIDRPAIWEGGGNAPSYPSANDVPTFQGSWIYLGGSGGTELPVTQSWRLDGAVLPGSFVNLPPVQYRVGTDLFTGSIETTFMPSTTASVNSPQTRFFTTNPPPPPPPPPATA